MSGWWWGVWRAAVPPWERWRGDFLENFELERIGPMFLVGGLTEQERQVKYAEHRALGYTHVGLSTVCTYPLWPTRQWDWWDAPRLFRARAAEIQAAGFRCVPILTPRETGDGAIAISLHEHLDRLAAWWPLARLPEFDAVQWGYEIDNYGGEWARGGRQLDLIAGLHRITGLPVLVHFTPERWGGWPDEHDPDRDETEWLRRAAEAGAGALLYQVWPHTPEAEVVFTVTGIPSRASRPGIAGRVVDGAGLRFIMYEYSRRRARGQALGRELMRHPTVSGFANGG